MGGQAQQYQQPIGSLGQIGMNAPTSPQQIQQLNQGNLGSILNQGGGQMQQPDPRGGGGFMGPTGYQAPGAGNPMGGNAPYQSGFNPTQGNGPGGGATAEGNPVNSVGGGPALPHFYGHPATPTPQPQQPPSSGVMAAPPQNLPYMQAVQQSGQLQQNLMRPFNQMGGGGGGWGGFGGLGGIGNAQSQFGKQIGGGAFPSVGGHTGK